MKSRTSCFNATVFRKNLTRFAPCWGLYSVFALMALILLVGEGGNWMADNLVGAVHVLCVITPIYAMICAQLLFGDLYNSRMCNALHALPLKRETWFFTNVLSGFAFHLIPSGLLTVLILPVLAFCCPDNSAWGAPIFLVGSNLQFMLFFGLAVFCAFCVGSRFAQGLLYAIVNFGSVILSWLVDTIFVPMYYGIRINMAPFQLFSPIVFMANAPFAEVERLYVTETLNINDLVGFAFHPDEGTVYYFIVAALGIGLLFGAQALYRRRKLECAGDFLAIRGLEPVFLVIYSVIIGAVFHFIANEMIGMETYLFLFIGLTVGWFTGKMLLERTPRVFRKKNVLRCGILLLICALIIVGALMDPFGIEDWIPEAEQVESVTVSEGSYLYPNYFATVETSEDIAWILEIHEGALEEYRRNYPHDYTFETAYKELVVGDSMYVSTELEPIPADMAHYSNFTIAYKLTNGRSVKRYYRIWLGEEQGEYLKALFSRPETLLGYGEDLSRFLTENSRLYVQDTWEGNSVAIRTQSDLTGLYLAILADCRAENMSQPWTFHRSDDSLYWISFDNGREITVYSNCENTLNWLRAYGLNVDEMLENHGK